MWFSRIKNTRRNDHARRAVYRSIRLQVENLEGRLLLSGDVTVDLGIARSPRHVPAPVDPTFVLGIPVNWVNVQWLSGLVAQPGAGPSHGGPNSPQGGQGPFAPNSSSPMNGTDASAVAALMIQADAITPAPSVDAVFQQMSPSVGTF